MSMMKMSFHKRRGRSESLPPQRARSPIAFILAAALLTATMALAAKRMGAHDDAPAPDAKVAAAEQATHDLVDERVRLHLKRLGG
jgi:hypothetical protein